jgi:hypothetical protein
MTSFAETETLPAVVETSPENGRPLPVNALTTMALTASGAVCRLSENLAYGNYVPEPLREVYLNHGAHLVFGFAPVAAAYKLGLDKLSRASQFAVCAATTSVVNFSVEQGQDDLFHSAIKFYAPVRRLENTADYAFALGGAALAWALSRRGRIRAAAEPQLADNQGDYSVNNAEADDGGAHDQRAGHSQAGADVRQHQHADRALLAES